MTCTPKKVKRRKGREKVYKVHAAVPSQPANPSMLDPGERISLLIHMPHIQIAVFVQTGL